MVLLSVDSVTKHFGPEPVLAGVTFDVQPGERIGLVGPNGSGKTTLLTILAGDQQADSGTIRLHPSATARYLQQHVEFAPEQTVWDVALVALQKIAALSHEAEEVAVAIGQTPDELQRARLEKRFDFLQHELHHRDGYHLDHKIERVLAGLGLTPTTFQQPVQQLSGGQQNRLLLAQMLLAEPDLMLLDEPSNHLDIAATNWLEEYLSRTKQAMILVSHDRYFLDHVTSRTLELYRGTVDSYPGNFSVYWRQKAERLQVQQRTYQRQQTEIAKLKDFIRRNQYGQKHAQAEDRKKKLERIELVPPPREIATVPMGFTPRVRCGDVALRAEHITKGYDKTLFADLSFDIVRGQRWGILGANGTGKTTLLRCLLDRERLDDGKVMLGTGVETAYFDQALSCLNADSEVVEAIRPDRKELNEKARRDILARFGIIGDMALQKVRSLSGGERNRTALARLAAAGANFLVLDEPTNHLDLWACDALEKSLKQFAGTVLFVSHDRYFINQVADHLLVVESDRFRIIEGNYDTYLHLVQQGLAGSRHEGEPAENLRDGPKATRKMNSMSPQRGGASEQKRTRKFPYRKVDDLEAEIFEHEENIQQLHHQLTLPEVLRDGKRVKEIHLEIESHQQTLATLYQHWEEATELN